MRQFFADFPCRPAGETGDTLSPDLGSMWSSTSTECSFFKPRCTKKVCKKVYIEFI